MAVSLTYLPGKIADILNYAAQLKDFLNATGFDPATLVLAANGFDATPFLA